MSGSTEQSSPSPLALSKALVTFRPPHLSSLYPSLLNNPQKLFKVLWREGGQAAGVKRVYSIYTGYIGREGLCQLCGPLGNKDWPDPHYGLSPSLYAGVRGRDSIFMQTIPNQLLVQCQLLISGGRHSILQNLSEYVRIAVCFETGSNQALKT